MLAEATIFYRNGVLGQRVAAYGRQAVIAAIRDEGAGIDAAMHGGGEYRAARGALLCGQPLRREHAVARYGRFFRRKASRPLASRPTILCRRPCVSPHMTSGANEPAAGAAWK